MNRRVRKRGRRLSADLILSLIQDRLEHIIMLAMASQYFHRHLPYTTLCVAEVGLPILSAILSHFVAQQVRFAPSM